MRKPTTYTHTPIHNLILFCLMFLFESKRLMVEASKNSLGTKTTFVLGYFDDFNIKNTKVFNLLWQRGMKVVHYNDW